MFNRVQDPSENEEASVEAVQAAAENARYGPIPDGFFNITGAAEYLGVTTNNVRRILKDGRIEGAFKEEDNQRWLIPQAGLDKYSETKGSRQDGTKAFVIKIDPDDEDAVLKALSPFGVEALVPRYKPKKQEAK